MSLLGDAWGMLPGYLKFFIGLAIFLYAGVTLLTAIIVLWNVIGINGINAINGCLTGSSPESCLQPQEGILIFGVNIADYWTITLLLIMIPIVGIAVKWYAMVLKKD